jgi:hypothetical protein
MSELEALAKRVNALSPPDRLRLAAVLMEHRRADVALPIIQNVADELRLAIMLSSGRRAAAPPSEKA